MALAVLLVGTCGCGSLNQAQADAAIADLSERVKDNLEQGIGGPKPPTEDAEQLEADFLGKLATGAWDVPESAGSLDERVSPTPDEEPNAPGEGF